MTSEGAPNNAIYTIADYEKAKATHDAVELQWSNYDGNNPDKYDSNRKEARRDLWHIEKYLKRHGIIPASDSEMLHFELERLHPDALSKSVVTHNGKQYRRRYSPSETSRSGKTVKGWIGWWEEVK